MGKEESKNPDAPAVDEDGGPADWVKIGLLLLNSNYVPDNNI